MKLRLIGLLLFILSTSTVFGQATGDSLSFVLSNYSDNALFNYFDKQLNTYHLSNRFEYSQNFGKFNVGIKERFNSAVIKSRTLNIRDEINLSMITEYNYINSLKFGFLTTSDIFTDDRSLALNESTQNLITVYSKYSPMKTLKIIPFAGFIENKQIGTTNSGFIYGGEALLDDLKGDIFSIYSSFKFQNEDISPRKNMLRYFNVRIENDLDQTFSNLFTGGYSEKKRDFYFEADSLTENYFEVTKNIQSRTENNYYLQNNIVYSAPGSNLAFDITGTINFRKVERETRYKNQYTVNQVNFDSNIEEFRYELEANATYITKPLKLIFRSSIGEREELHDIERLDGINDIIFEDRQNLEKKKNNRSQVLMASITGTAEISRKDQIGFSLFQRKLSYNTPSDENFDDRDELLSIMRLSYNRKITPYFNWFMNLEGSFNHLVYIFSERSANNSKRRTLKLSSGGRYNTEKVSSLNEAIVSANYTTYDFEELRPNLKSFSFRQFTVRDSSYIDIYNKTGMLIEGYIKLSEQGDFYWNNFSSTPQRYIEELYFEPKLVKTYNNISFSSGLRIFRLFTFKHIDNETRELDTKYSSIGPVADISVMLSSLRLKIYGWYEFINTEAGKELENVNLIMRLNWIL